MRLTTIEKIEALESVACDSEYSKLRETALRWAAFSLTANPKNACPVRCVESLRFCFRAYYNSRRSYFRSQSKKAGQALPSPKHNCEIDLVSEIWPRKLAWFKLLNDDRELLENWGGFGVVFDPEPYTTRVWIGSLFDANHPKLTERQCYALFYAAIVDVFFQVEQGLGLTYKPWAMNGRYYLSYIAKRLADDMQERGLEPDRVLINQLYGA